MIRDTKGGNFDTVPSRFVFLKSSTILDLVKSLICKVCSLTRIQRPHNFAREADLEKMDGEALTFGDVQTFCFLVVGFLGSTFLA